MNGKRAKLLKKGAEQYNLPYEKLKKAYKRLNAEARARFVEEASL